MDQPFYALISTSRGVAAAVGTRRGIAALIWPQPSADRARRHAARWLESRPRRVAATRSATALGEVPADRLPAGLAGKLADYFAGRSVDFSAVPLDLSAVPPFRARVLTALRKIGYGRTISYAGLARRVGRAGAARAVGQAMAHNPIPIIVPCHRVLRSDGGLGGFSAGEGIALKRQLLAMESAEAGA